MTKFTIAVAVACLAGAAALYAAQMPIKVEMKDVKGESVGTATITEAKGGSGVSIALDLKNHGLNNPAGPHAGDMQNFTVKPDGTAKATITDPRVNMGTDNHSILAGGGTALVIHAAPDDMKTDPAGAAGARIACGAITK